MRYPNGSTARPVVTSRFGPRKAPTPGASTFHRGTDYVGFSTVCAVAPGVVTVVGTPRGWAGGGVQVWVQHDGFLARYLHLAARSPKVREGQRVTAGQPLGVMGKTGTASGVHLHLEIVVRGSQVDPDTYLTARIDRAEPAGRPADTPPTPTSLPIQEDDMPTLVSSEGGQTLAIEGAIVPLVTPEEVQSIVITPGRLECAQSVHARINAAVGSRTIDDLIVNVIGGNGTRYVWAGGKLSELGSQDTIDQLVAMGARGVDWPLVEVQRLLAQAE